MKLTKKLVKIVIDKSGPFITKRMKGNTQKWFDGEFWEKLNSADKSFQKFTKYRLNTIKELFNKAKVKLKLIAMKNLNF